MLTVEVCCVKWINKVTSYLWCLGSDSVRNRSSRAAAVCFVLLCVLLLTAVIVLCVHIHTKTTNYTEERDWLLTNITRFTEERNRLISKNENLTNERNQLISKNENLTNERDQLRNHLQTSGKVSLIYEVMFYIADILKTLWSWVFSQ